MPFAANEAAVQACTAAASKANTGSLQFTCVVGGSDEACLDLVSKSGADMVVLGGEAWRSAAGAAGATGASKLRPAVTSAAVWPGCRR